MAGNPLMAPLLLGLGVHSLSMAESRVPTIKELIQRSSFSDMQALGQEVLQFSTTEGINELLENFQREKD